MIKFLFLILVYLLIVSGLLLFVIARYLFIEIFASLDSLTVFQTATLLGAVFSFIALASILVRPWWKRRKWYRDMYDFSHEMVPFTPLEVDVLDDANSENYNAFVGAYRVKMESIPDELNRSYRNRPSNAQVSERVIECLCNEGYVLRDRLRESSKNEAISHAEVKVSVQLMESASLVIRHQIEEEVWMFRPRKTQKLSEYENIVPQKDRARKINDSLDVDLIRDIRSELLDGYHETTQSSPREY